MIKCWICFYFIFVISLRRKRKLFLILPNWTLFWNNLYYENVLTAYSYIDFKIKYQNLLYIQEVSFLISGYSVSNAITISIHIYWFRINDIGKSLLTWEKILVKWIFEVPLKVLKLFIILSLTLKNLPE